MSEALYKTYTNIILSYLSSIFCGPSEKTGYSIVSQNAVL